jgi:hypothetical protein
MPPFQFYNLDGSLNKQAPKAGISTCIIYFDPECDHCEFETAEITKHINAFPHTEFIMVSSGTSGKIADFITKFKLREYPQITVLQDKANKFNAWFGLSEVPSIYIYDENGWLKRKFVGETRFEAIVKSLK